MATRFQQCIECGKARMKRDADEHWRKWHRVAGIFANAQKTLCADCQANRQLIGYHGRNDYFTEPKKEEEP